MALKIEVGKVYKSRQGSAVQIVSTISEVEPCFAHGFRFRDLNRESYKADGSWAFKPKHKTDKDLIEEI